MAKKVDKKLVRRAEPKKKQEIIEQQEVSSEQLSNQRSASQNRRGRQDNSLSVLTKKFIQLIKSNQNSTIDLNQAVQLLGVQKRRIYDITNVLQGINYVQKKHKNTIKWIGANEDPNVDRQILQLRKNLEDVGAQERKVDEEIATINQQIREEFLDNEQLQQFHYITFEDCKNLAKSLSKGNDQKSLIVVQAPKGTSLQVAEQEHGHCKLMMNAQGKGPISVFTCSANQGVKKLQMNLANQ